MTRMAGGVLAASTLAFAAAVASASETALFEYAGPHFVLHAAEWAGLGRYAGENRAPPGAGQGVIVLMGDSIFDLWDDPDNVRTFPAGAVNRGISAQTTFQMLLRFRADVLALKPDTVVLLAGTNDIAGLAGPVDAGMVADNLATMAELARAHGIRVLLATLPPVCDCKKTPAGTPIEQTRHRPPAKIAELNRRIADYARDNGFGLVDFHAALGDGRGFFREELTLDGVHPNLAGYKIMKARLQEAVAASRRRPHDPR